MYIPTDDEMNALHAWRAYAGVRWKIALRLAWSDGFQARGFDQRYVPYLQGLRNAHGPRWLARFVLCPKGWNKVEGGAEVA